MHTSKKETANSLKQAMRHLPSSVVIVTAAFGKLRKGATVGSFTSVSLEPPLISFNISKDSQMYTVLERATHFGVHLPLPEHEEICNHFAHSGQSAEQQFEAVPHYRNAYGTPVLKPISSFLQCRSYDRLEAGDHTIFVGEVTEIEKRKPQQSGIFYCDRKYHSIPETPAKVNIPVKKVG